MSVHNIRLSQALFTLLLGIVAMPVFSLDSPTGISTAYSTNFMQNEVPGTGVIKNAGAPAIFKFTDNNGKITYSTAIPHDFIDAQEIPVTEAPSDGYIKATRQINAELKSAAQQLTEAREARKAVRDEKEKQRLERLVLINRAKPPVVYQHNNTVAYPYRIRPAKHYNGYRYPAKPAHLPAAGHRPLRHTPPAGAISQAHHR